MGIYDNQKSFAIRLAEYANTKEQLPFLVVAFTEQKAVQEYLLKKELVYLLVGGDDDTFDGVKVVKLSETATEEPGTIYRYQKAGDLIQEMRLQFQEMVDECATGQVFAVTSACGGIGKTSVSLELMRQLPCSMYLGMEVVSSFVTEHDNLGHLLYGIMHMQEDILKQLWDMKEPCGMGMMIHSPDFFSDLQSLDGEHFSWFLKRLRQEQPEINIVLDMDIGVSPEIISCSERVIMLHGDGSLDDEKTENIKRAWKRQGMEELYARVEHVYLTKADYVSLRQVASSILHS